MQTMTRRALGAAGLALMASASVVWAQQAPPVRVRGEITKVEGTTLSVKLRDGQNATVKLAEPVRISAMVKAPLADGLGMLLHQAVRGFQLWFGVRPEVTPELRSLIEADLIR